MSKSADSSKYKSKKYFRKKNLNKPTVQPKLKGFLCSCNSREKDCIKESYNILNEYANKLYKIPDSEGAAVDDDEDISESLTKEISGLQQENKPDKKRFQVVESGAKNVLFIRANIENPVELAEAIVKDIHETKNQKTRFLLRLIPIEVTCKANLDDIGNAFVQLAEKHFKDTPQTFSILYNHRNNNDVSRDEVVKLIADKVFEMRSDHKVDLKCAKLTIIVEVIKGFAFLSVIPDYVKYKKYNLLSLSSPDEATEAELK